MQQLCPACQHTFNALALAGVVCCPRCARSFDAAQDGTSIVQGLPADSARVWVAQAGENIGRYQLQRQLGQGGMAEVWLALAQNQECVIKLLLPQVANNEHICKRFDREIESLKRFDHPHIIPISDHGVHQGRPYYVTPVHAKNSLRKTIDQLHGKSIKTELLQRIAQDCLLALEHAHQHQIIHRDIKPENILELNNGRFALGDFGIAHMHSTHDGNTLTLLTNTNVVLGTYAYMAPEQSRGSRDIDARADLYALGVVLYECISSHLPEGRFEDPDHYLKHLPVAEQQHWNTFILCLLERDPERRYRNAQTALAILKVSNPPLEKTAKIVAPTASAAYPHGRKFYRYSTHGWIGGICSGLSAWSGIDVGWIRFAFCLGFVWTAGVLFLVYLALILLVPACPQVYYQPRPFNHALPVRGNGWFFGVCEMLGKRSASPAAWRIICILLSVFSGFIFLFPYLAIGIVFPKQQKLPQKLKQTKKHQSDNYADEARTSLNPVPSLWPSFLYALPISLSLGYAGYYSYTELEFAMASVFAGLTLYFAGLLHARTPMTPINFTGLGSGLVIGGGSLLACLILIQVSNHNGSFSGQETPFYLVSIISIFLGVLISLCRGYYGPLAVIMGLLPASGLLVLHALQDETFFKLNLFDPVPLPAILSLLLFGTLWLICARIAQTMLRWLINPTENVTRQYSLSASIIGLSFIASAVVAGLYFTTSLPANSTIDTIPKIRTLIHP